MTESKRIDYLDMAKGIGILLVIIGHISYVSEPVRQYISSFHMPLFFVISGILLCYKQEENSSLREFAGRKFKGLMMPYYFFSLCVLLIESARIIWKNANTWENVFRQAFQSLCLQGVSVLWFLPALFMAEMVFLFLRKRFKPLGTVICLVVLCFVTYCGSLFVQECLGASDNLSAELCYDVFSMIFRNLFCVSFVGMGYYFAFLWLDRKSSWRLELSLTIILFVFTGTIAKLYGAVDLRGMNLGNLLWFVIGGCFGSVGVILLCRLIAKVQIKFLQSFLIFLGCNSLLIMVTHLDFRVLYVSIRLAEGLRENLLKSNALFCTSIVVFVILIECVIIFFVNLFRKKLKCNGLKNS